jgi:hypothetical protein
MTGGMSWKEAAQGVFALLLLAVTLLVEQNGLSVRPPAPANDAGPCAGLVEEQEAIPCLPDCDESLDPVDPNIYQVCELPAYADFQQAVERWASVRARFPECRPSGGETAPDQQSAADVRQALVKLKARVDPALWASLLGSPFGPRGIVRGAGLSDKELSGVLREVPE